MRRRTKDMAPFFHPRSRPWVKRKASKEDRRRALAEIDYENRHPAAETAGEESENGH